MKFGNGGFFCDNKEETVKVFGKDRKVKGKGKTLVFIAFGFGQMSTSYVDNF